MNNMNKRLSAITSVGLLVGCAGVAQADQVTFDFNPVDFFDFRHHTEGISTQGGMFRLHETGGFEGSPIYDSWDDGGWATLDALRNSLDDAFEDEGIGYIQIYLPKAPEPGGNVAVWGQTLTADPLVAPSGTAPAGWQPLGSTDTAEAWIYQWQSDSSDYYVRPGEDFGSFGLTFTANETVTVGEPYTIWFGGDNYPGFVPAISFDTFPGGFPSIMPTVGVGTTYESTLSLTAIPEPAMVAQLLGLGLIAAGVVWRRWRRRRR